ITTENLAQGAFDRERMRVLFDQLEFRTLLPRMLDAIGDVATAPESEAFEVDVVIARDAKAAAEALRAAANGERVALEARWEGKGLDRVAGVAVSAGEDPVYIDGDLLADAAVRD